MYDDDTSIFAGLFILSFLVIFLAVQIGIAFLLYDGLRRLHPKHRTAEPYFAWLTLIPVAGIVFSWLLLPFKIPESFGRYFSENPTSVDIPEDFGKSMGLATMILLTLCLVPLINMIAWIPGLVCFVLYLLQFQKMRQLLPAQTRGEGFAELERLKNLLDKGVLTQAE